MANIYHVIHMKLNQLVQENVHMINKAYLSAITVTFLRVFTYKMATKINWQRHGTKLRLFHPCCWIYLVKVSRIQKNVSLLCTI